jgi:hypothetical protein
MDVEELSDDENRLRHFLEFVYRFSLAVFLSCQLVDFLFNPIWMHGYLWFVLFLYLIAILFVFRCLNLPIEMDMSDKSAGIILDHQLEQIGYIERLIHSTLGVCAVILILR